MATFAPQINDNIAYEQPTQVVQSNVGEMLVRGASALFADKARVAKASAKTGPDPLVNGFLDGMRKIEAQRAAGQGDRATINERILVQNFVSAGGSLDAELKATVEATTGRPFSYMGQTEDQRQMEAMTKSAEFQTSYIAAKAMLGPDATEEELTQVAIKSVSEQAVAKDTIARIQAGEKVNWELQGAAAYDSMITAFQQTAVGGLSMMVESGGMMTPNDVLAAKQQWDMLKASGLKRPKGVSDEQWKSIQDRMDKTDALFTTLTKAASSEQALEQMKSVLAQGLGPTNEMDPVDMLTGLSLLSDPAGALDILGVNSVEAIGNLFKRSPSLKKTDTGTSLTQNLTDNTPDGRVTGNTIITEVPEEWGQYKGVSAEQQVNDLKSGGVLMSTVTPQTISKPGVAKQFAEGMQSTGVVLMTSEKFISSKLMGELVGGSNVRANLQALDNIDPEAANEARVLIRSGLQNQTTKLRANLEKIEASDESGGYNLGLTWDETEKKYYITNEDFFNHIGQIRGANWLKSTLVEGKGIPVGKNDPWATDGIKQAYDRRSAINIAEKAMKDFAIEEPEAAGEVSGAGVADKVSGGQGADTAVEYKIGASVGVDFAGIESSNGFPPGYVERMAMIESRGNPMALNKSTKAAGLFQFVPGTAREYGLKDPFDPKQATEAMIRFTNDNMNAFKKRFGREPSGAELYLMHQQGRGGAMALMSYPDGNVVDVLATVYKGDRNKAARAVTLNGGDTSMTAGQFAGLWADKYNNVKSTASHSSQLGYSRRFDGKDFSPTDPGAPPSMREQVGPDGYMIPDQPGVDTVAPVEPIPVGDLTEGEPEKASAKEAREDLKAAVKQKEVTPDVIKEMVDKILSPQQKRQMRAAGYNPDEVNFFEDAAEAEAALERGEVEPGSLYVDKNGKLFILE